MVLKKWINKYQYKLLKINSQLSFITAQIIGLWPFVFDTKKNLFKTSTSLRLYAGCAFLFQYVCLLSSVTVAIRSNFNWKSYSSVTIINIYGVLYVFCFVLDYLHQFTNFHKIEIIVTTGRQFYFKIRHYLNLRELSFMRLLIFYTFIYIILPIYSLYLSTSILKFLTDPSERRSFIFYFLTVMPNLIISVMPNIFMGAILMGYFLFMELNKVLENVMKTARALIKVESSGSKYFRMNRFCELSDRLDEVAVIHLELSTLLKNINNAFSIQLLSYLTYKTTSEVVHMFLLYMCFYLRTRNLLDIPTEMLWSVILEVLVLWTQIFLLTSTCNHLKLEVNMSISDKI